MLNSFFLAAWSCVAANCEVNMEHVAYRHLYLQGKILLCKSENGSSYSGRRRDGRIGMVYLKPDVATDEDLVFVLYFTRCQQVAFEPPVTALGFQQLALLPRLKILNPIGESYPEEALEAFRKLRPDVKVVRGKISKSP